MEYAIVDIETTGGHAAGSRITEIAIHIHDGKSVIETYETLINPKQPIPDYITALTGINDELVAKSPCFSDIAGRVHSLLVGRVFVAHNVNFDYSFVKHHLSQSGYDINLLRLCTVRLGRKCWPGLPSYSLGKLCRALSIPLVNQHRAGGDTAATAILFSRILESPDGLSVVESMLKRTRGEQTLPSNLPKADIDALPKAPGVYYFHDQKGQVIYVGKAKDLRKRVTSHFTGSNPTRQRQHFMQSIHSITFERCGTELMALLLEAAEIKRLWPLYNRAMKRFEPAYAMYQYEDRQGYMRLVVDKRRKHQPALYTFDKQIEGVNLLHRLVVEYGLCPKLCLLQRGLPVCAPMAEYHCPGACEGRITPAEYNVRAKQALAGLFGHLPSFAIIDAGRTDDEQSCMWVENGQFYGMGYIDRDMDMRQPDDIKSLLTPYTSNDYMLRLVMAYASRYPHRVVQTGNGTLDRA